MAVDQMDLTNINEKKKHNERLSQGLFTLGTNFYFIGTILFLVGAGNFNVNRPAFSIEGNILWIIGSMYMFYFIFFKYIMNRCFFYYGGYFQALHKKFKIELL